MAEKKSNRERAAEVEFKASVKHLPAAEQRKALDTFRKEQAGEVATVPVEPSPLVQEARKDGEARYVPNGPLTAIEIPILGWPGTAWFDLRARYEALAGSTGDTDTDSLLRRIMVLCPVVKWAGQVDPLTGKPLQDCVAPDAGTYRVLMGRGVEVGLWIIRGGAQEAAEQEMGEV